MISTQRYIMKTANLKLLLQGAAMNLDLCLSKIIMKYLCKSSILVKLLPQDLTYHKILSSFTYLVIYCLRFQKHLWNDYFKKQVSLAVLCYE